MLAIAVRVAPQIQRRHVYHAHAQLQRALHTGGIDLRLQIELVLGELLWCWEPKIIRRGCEIVRTVSRIHSLEKESRVWGLLNGVVPSGIERGPNRLEVVEVMKVRANANDTDIWLLLDNKLVIVIFTINRQQV